MSQKSSLALGVVTIVMGMTILFSSHSYWGLRGVAYTLFGIYLVRKSQS